MNVIRCMTMLTNVVLIGVMQFTSSPKGGNEMLVLIVAFFLSCTVAVCHAADSCPTCPQAPASDAGWVSTGNAGSAGTYGSAGSGSYGSHAYRDAMRASRRVARRSGGSAGSYGSAGRSGSWGFPVARLVTAPIRLVNKVRLNRIAVRADRGNQLAAARTERALARRGD